MLGSTGSYIAFLRVMSHEMAKPGYGLQRHVGNVLRHMPDDDFVKALRETAYHGDFCKLKGSRAQALMNGVLYETCQVMGWQCPDAYILTIKNFEQWQHNDMNPTNEAERDAHISKPLGTAVLTLDELNWVVESSVLTIMNDRVMHDRAEEALKKRHFLPMPLCNDAIKASGDDVYKIFVKINAHPSHRNTIRKRMAMKVAEVMDGVTCRHNITDETMNKLADLYRPKYDFTGLERRVANHLTADAFSAMNEVEQIKWLHGLYQPELEQADKDIRKRNDMAVAYGAANAFLDDKEHYNPCGEIILGNKAETVLTDVVTSHITDPVNNSGTFKILGESLEKPMNNYETAVEKREDLVFGHELSKLNKSQLMSVIRDAKEHAKSFDDLAEESTYAAEQIATVKVGIAKVLKVLDKK